jgi:hypothetical protein
MTVPDDGYKPRNRNHVDLDPDEREQRRRQRISRSKRRDHATSRAQAMLAPRDLRALRKHGAPVIDALKPLLRDAAAEVVALLTALGGEDTVSPQERSLIESAARLHVIERGHFMRWAQTHDPEDATRVASCAQAKRAALTSLGLQRREREVVSLGEYLALASSENEADAREAGASATNVTDSDAAVEVEVEDAAQANVEGEAVEDERDSDGASTSTAKRKSAEHPSGPRNRRRERVSDPPLCGSVRTEGDPAKEEPTR